ncbi:hypothetical protein [Desulfobotulus alkaliphilus]
MTFRCTVCGHNCPESRVQELMDEAMEERLAWIPVDRL